MEREGATRFLRHFDTPSKLLSAKKFFFSKQIFPVYVAKRSPHSPDILREGFFWGLDPSPWKISGRMFTLSEQRSLESQTLNSRDWSEWWTGSSWGDFTSPLRYPEK